MTEPKITHNSDASTVTIEGEIPTERWSAHKSAALTSLGSDVTVAGFRKGHVPDDILIKHVGEYALLREMAERAISEHYGTLLVEYKIDAIGRPDVTITKLAFGNPLGFTLTTAVLPKVELPDYRALALKALKGKATGEPEVTDKEVEEFVTNLLNDRAKAEGKEKADETLTDDAARSFGDFKDAAEFRAKIKEGMTLDKKRAQREERRMAIIDALVADTKVSIPDVLIDAEINKMMGQFEHDLSRMGITAQDYLLRTKKDEATLRTEFRPDAEKRAKIQLILSEIGSAEKLLPTEDEVGHEVDHLLSHHEPHEGHDEERERESAAIYVTTILTNEKVLSFLEDPKPEAKEAEEK